MEPERTRSTKAPRKQVVTALGRRASKDIVSRSENSAATSADAETTGTRKMKRDRLPLPVHVGREIPVTDPANNRTLYRIHTPGSEAFWKLMATRPREDSPSEGRGE